MALALAIGTVGAAGSAQEPARAALIKQQIEQVAKNITDVMSLFGTTNVLEAIIRSQAKAEPFTLSLELQKGDKRTVVAFCNPDCPPVAIAVNDASGKEIATDRDHPAVASVTAESAGRHAVSILFSGCQTPSCDVGVLVLEHKPSR